MHFLIIDSPYYADITAELVAGAVEALETANATHDRFSVPGVLEIPAALAMASAPIDNPKAGYDGFVLLGCVIRGETTHYEIVSNESARAIMDLATVNMLAVGNGILTVENGDQAWARARRSEGNKGGGAAEAALRMARLRKELEL